MLGLLAIMADRLKIGKRKDKHLNGVNGILWIFAGDEKGRGAMGSEKQEKGIKAVKKFSLFPFYCLADCIILVMIECL